jgi:hypothetical protein
MFALWKQGVRSCPASDATKKAASRRSQRPQAKTCHPTTTAATAHHPARYANIRAYLGVIHPASRKLRVFVRHENLVDARCAAISAAKLHDHRERGSKGTTWQSCSRKIGEKGRQTRWEDETRFQVWRQSQAGTGRDKQGATNEILHVKVCDFILITSLSYQRGIIFGSEI